MAAASARLFSRHEHAGEGAGRAGQRNLADRLGEKAADGVDVLVFDVAAEELAQLGNRVACGHAPGARLCFLGFDGVVVVFVGEFTDDLLEDVLEGDQAGDAAVFVDDDGHVEALGLHLAQHVVRGLHFDGVLGGAHHLLGAQVQVAAGGFPAGDQVFEEQDASDVVHVVADDGDAREAGAHEQAQGGGRGRVRVDGHHVGARHHDLAHERVPQVQDGSDHVTVLFLEAFGFADLVDDFTQVGDQFGARLRFGWFGGGTRGAQAGQQRVCDVAEAREAISQPRSAQRDSFGVARAPLGGQEGDEDQLDHCDDGHRDEAIAHQAGACPPGRWCP